MKNKGLISILHVILFSMTFIGLKNHVTILPAILNDTGRDSWISVIFAGILIFPWLFLLLFIQRKTQKQSLRDLIQQSMGRVGSSIIFFIIIVYLMVLAAFSMRETLLWVSTTFLTETPVLIPLFVYLILCIIFITTGLQTMAMVNVLVLFVVVILGFLVAIVNIQVKDYWLIMPFFEHGLSPVLYGMVYPASGFVELLLLLFLQHKVKNPLKWYHFAVMLVILMGLTLGPLIGAIVEFGPEEAANQRYPAYEEWGLATIGSFVEHIDFFSVYQWMTGTFIRVGLILFIVTDILNITGNSKKIWTFVAPPFSVIVLSLFLVNDEFFLKMNEKYFLISTFFFFILLSIFLMIIAIISDKKANRCNTDNAKESGEQQWNQENQQIQSNQQNQMNQNNQQDVQMQCNNQNQQAQNNQQNAQMQNNNQNQQAQNNQQNYLTQYTQQNQQMQSNQQDAQMNCNIQNSPTQNSQQDAQTQNNQQNQQIQNSQQDAQTQNNQQNQQIQNSQQDAQTQNNQQNQQIQNSQQDAQTQNNQQNQQIQNSQQDAQTQNNQKNPQMQNSQQNAQTQSNQQNYLTQYTQQEPQAQNNQQNPQMQSNNQNQQTQNSQQDQQTQSNKQNPLNQNNKQDTQTQANPPRLPDQQDNQ